ncbi:MAG: methyltransferase domain-containing protein [Burkholderiales bacterium]|nr:methyltransferase domain-containing protein [Burkholderiales bacterium]
MKSLFDVSAFGLEIGPGFSPLLPRSAGYKVETLDRVDAETLRLKYRDTDVDISKIETVDHVTNGGSIFGTILKRQNYDFIVASRVLQHTVDPLGFLQDCDKLLKPGGVLVLAVLDKRFAFDALRPVSTTGEVLQAHFDRRGIHSFGALFDEIAYNCSRDKKVAWYPDEMGELEFASNLELAVSLVEKARATNEFHDINAWQFTPSSVRLIINDLAAIGYLPIKQAGFISPGQGEIFISLSRNGKGPGIPRIQLAKGTVAECKEIATQDG